MRGLPGLALAFALVCVASGAAPCQPLHLGGTTADGRSYHLEESRGCVIALTIASRYTREESERINGTLAPDLGPNFRLITIVDLRGVPRLFHGLARRRITQVASVNPVKYLVDDRGTWASALGAAPDKHVDIVVVDRNGELRGHFVGEDQVRSARALIRELRGTTAAE